MQLSEAPIGNEVTNTDQVSTGNSCGDSDGRRRMTRRRQLNLHNGQKERDDGSTSREREELSTADEQNEPEKEDANTSGTASSRLSSSTPRKKNNILENLRSTLSPKYIGFTTTPPPFIMSPEPSSNERTRSSRRRNLNTSCGEVSAVHINGGTDSSVIGCIRLTRSNASSPSGAAAAKPFVSPIDKLLAKNGSTTPDRAAFDAVKKRKVFQSEDMPTSTGCEPIVCKIEICEGHDVEASQSTTDIVDIETMIPLSIVETSSPKPFEEEEIAVREAQIEITVTVTGTENKETAEELTNESSDAVTADRSTRRTSLTSAVTIVDSQLIAAAQISTEQSGGNEDTIKTLSMPLRISLDETAEHEMMNTSYSSGNNAHLAHPHNAKSPSAASVDSAKGSSVVTGIAWVAFSTGDLFWGQIYSYCYWPCMVCPDPDGKTITTERNARNGEQHVMVHVRFFADNGRRNWVKRENLIPYVGLKKYKEYGHEVRERWGVKSSKFTLLLPKRNKLHVWHKAVREADTVAAVLYSDRLEKFYEIYECSKAQQNVRKRRDSMIVPPTIRSASGSQYNSLENLYNNGELAASSPLAAPKRGRSSSPFSPVYSPLKPPTGPIKRRRISSLEVDDRATNGGYAHSMVSQSSDDTAAQSTSTQAHADAEVFSNGEFKKFYQVMRDYVMDQNTDDKLENSLLVAVRNIWALREINRSQLQRQLLEDFDENELGSTLIESGSRREGGGVKRLSNRLKKIMIRRSLPPATTTKLEPEPSSNAASASATHKRSVDGKPRKPLNRPIEEVIDDIFNLDSKYLFKGLARDPVCKYCFQPGGRLLRCAGDGCQSWLHQNCIRRPQHSGMRKRSFGNQAAKEPVASTSTAQEVEKGPIGGRDHVTADDNSSTSVSAEPRTSDMHNGESESPVVCQECMLNKPATCQVCHITEDKGPAAEDKLVSCTMLQCTKVFHPSCCRYWPQAKITKSMNSIEAFRCPSHVCHTCVSDDPKGKFQHLSNSKLVRCVKCPATYHVDSTCIPAGSQILTASHIICPRHSSSSKSDAHVNVSWCFLCASNSAGGGQLICCETCPTAVHPPCLNIPVDANEGYICEECESGRLPLYGEMVWAKFNAFRWWPAIILPPTEVPQNIRRKAHNSADFVVRFFGTHDHGWIARRRVYLYLEGDSSEPPRIKSYLDASYTRGVEEAKKIYEIIKLKKQTQSLSNENKEKLHPQPYVRIKTNRPVPPVKLHASIERVNKCDCSPEDECPCGPESNCLNRVLYHECNPKICPAGDRCQNQMFETRISPRLEVLYMKECGFGLVCREAISAGTFIIEYVGEVINDDEFQRRVAQKSLDREENFYFLLVEKDYIIDAGPKGNLARFMNHSCEPNCETQKWSVNGLNRIGLFAIKDIPANTELTFNYHWDDLLSSNKKTCHCGATKCAGQIGGKYKEDKSKEITMTPKTKAKKRGDAKKTKQLKRLQKKGGEAPSTSGTQKIKLKLGIARESPTPAPKSRRTADALVKRAMKTGTNQITDELGAQDVEEVSVVQQEQAEN